LSRNNRPDRAETRNTIGIVAVAACLIATGPIEMRLTYAAEHLIHLTPSQIPTSIADEFGAVYAELTRTRLDGPRSVSPEEGEKLAERIFSMFVKVMGGL
jgi:hypothetical protein